MRLRNPEAQAHAEESSRYDRASIQRTSHRGQVYFGPRTPIVASLHDSPDWPVFIDGGVAEDPNHVVWAMSLEQARQLCESLTVVLASARVRAEGAA